jgi:transposase
VFAAGVVDLHRAKLIDIVAGRSRKVLADWLFDQPTEWAAGIEVAALDPCRGYGAALSAGLPNAVRVLDPFHVVRLGFACVDDVRRRVQQPPMAIAAAAVTHCMASAGCCAAGPRT